MTKVSRTTWHALSFMFALLALASQAQADQITTFDATGTFADNSLLSGTLTIDTNSNELTAVNLTIGAAVPLAFNYSPSDFIYTSQGETVIEVFGSNESTLLLDVPVPTLLGFTSGPLGSQTTSSNTLSIYGVLSASAYERFLPSR